MGMLELVVRSRLGRDGIIHTSSSLVTHIKKRADSSLRLSMKKKIYFFFLSVSHTLIPLIQTKNFFVAKALFISLCLRLYNINIYFLTRVLCGTNKRPDNKKDISFLLSGLAFVIFN